MAKRLHVNPVISILRAQNWARVKGELEGLLETFQDSNPTKRLALEKVIVDFVVDIEEEMK